MNWEYLNNYDCESISIDEAKYRLSLKRDIVRRTGIPREVIRNLTTDCLLEL